MSNITSLACLILEAFDTLFFRDGRPFSMGDETWADGIFPPSPSVVYGALRSGYFAQHIDQISNAQTSADPTVGLVIDALCYRISPDDIFCFPAPLDLIERTDKTSRLRQEESDDKRFAAEMLLLERIADGCSSLGDTLGMLKTGGRVEPIEKGLIDTDELTRYLCIGNSGGDLHTSYQLRKLSDYICSEPKVGIGRDDQTRSSSDTGKLYRVGLLRPSANGAKGRIDLVVACKNLLLPDHGILRLGAEGKCVVYGSGEMPEIDISPISHSESRCFKLYFMTPAIFDKGWVAEWMLNGTYKGISFDFIGASIGRSLYLGGFDMKSGRPKPMRRAVPAGSVYYFELKEGNTLGACFDQLRDAFHGRSLADSSYCKCEQGYGIALLGTGA